MPFRSILYSIFIASGICAGAEPVAINKKDDGYRGIWYMNQPSGDKYKFKYSGGLGTYCAKHRPFAVYCERARKTFFCYGGTTEGSHRKHTPGDLSSGSKFSRSRKGFLLHMASYFDHATGMVPRPTIVLDKRTADAHDNPVISMDDGGHVWIFSTSHGRSRPSCIHRSEKPHSVEKFVRVNATRRRDGRDVPLDNFSYMQVWRVKGRGFIAFFTRYKYPADRTICWMTSTDGEKWSEWTRLAAMDKGHYQVSACAGSKACSAFNYHPSPGGLNWRTNLYYVETADFGAAWRTAGGKTVKLPLRNRDSAALVCDYEKKGLKVYLKDIRLDDKGRPVILFITSKGYQSGPRNDPRTWTTARWTGGEWQVRPVTTSDNNYDMGSLYLEGDGTWRVVGPTETGPQPYNPGGEMAMWTSADQGAAWKRVARLTIKSDRNHTYARRPVGAHGDFYALWADGHGRRPSESRLYFCNQKGEVFQLPAKMEKAAERPPAVFTRRISR